MFFFNVIFVGCDKISGELISNVRREEHTLTMCHECITNVLNTIYKYNFRLLFYPTLEIADIIKQNKKKRRRHSTFPKQFSVYFHPFLNFRLILQLVDPRKNKKEIIIFLSSSFSRSRNSEIENTHLKLFHRGYYFVKLHYFEVARVSVARKIKIKAGIEMFATHKEPVNKLPPRVQRFPPST